MRGSCLCGQVIYDVDRLASAPRHCACTTCRKSHAAAFNTSASVDASAFRWVAGESLLTGYASSPGKTRYFCRVCGTQMVARRDGSATIALRVATLDDDPGLRPHARIWGSDAVPWLADGPDILSYDRWEDPQASAPPPFSTTTPTTRSDP